ncbi:lipase/acyltransferase domain-containing protein [Pseudomonas syringae group sp. J254-4]|uniref:esterase/lipase family protein n=1 Tax=Pseudomonas syringae group sp. J254-4 TaxID=3079589 RepID=UPI002909E8C4|nr:alpha/beta hydrolase [Pseudomonas syringae group sp. J254-4]MDU8457796.1 alpha/beta hydrolase [Pseudomonas syringae group sp. J254-4]
MSESLKLAQEQNPDGTTSATTTMADSKQQQEKEIKVKSDKVVPIVFIPGIMGTNLWNTRTKKIAWVAPNTDTALSKVAAIGSFISAFFSSAKDRQNDLDGSDGVMTVYNDSEIGKDGLIDSVAEEDLRRRGWGGIMRSAYHPIMVSIQNQMNNIMNNNDLQGWWKENSTSSPSEWGDWNDNSPLEKDSIKHAAEIRYEVWAAGYNWLQSNADSAQDIINFIDKTVLPSYASADKVIIVTHSMGGLVARAMLGFNKYNKVYGVIHGAMPATGAPAAYRRIRAGFEGKGIEGYITRQILGPTAKETVAVLAFSKGGLELLPSAIYGDGKQWLFARKSGNPEVNLIGLPHAKNPYDDIYKSDKWWGLIPKENEDLIDPNDLLKIKKSDDWEYPISKRQKFEENIDSVKTFHIAIEKSYYPNTYVHYSADANEEDLITWSNIVWTSDWIGWGDINNLKITEDDFTGNIELGRGYRFKFGPKTSPGDGTVPVISAASSRSHPNVEAAFAHGKNSKNYPNVCKEGEYNNSPGYAHQNAYNDPKGRTQYATLYSLVKISKHVKI